MQSRVNNIKLSVNDCPGALFLCLKMTLLYPSSTNMKYRSLRSKRVKPRKDENALLKVISPHLLAPLFFPRKTVARRTISSHGRTVAINPTADFIALNLLFIWVPFLSVSFGGKKRFQRLGQRPIRRVPRVIDHN